MTADPGGTAPRLTEGVPVPAFSARPTPHRVTIAGRRTSPASAQAGLADHPQVSGVVLTQEQARRIGVDIFGHLLDD